MNNAFSLLPALLFLTFPGAGFSQAPETANPEKTDAASAPAAPTAAAPAPALPESAVKIDFQSATPGEVPDDVMVTDADASFTIVEDGENKLLQMNPSPLVEGGVLVGASLKGPARVSARILAAGKRRSHPRFGLGLHGAGGFRCLVVPAMKEIQLVKDDAVVAKVDYAWKSGVWTTIEFSVAAGPEGKGSALEGRVWQDGSPRPEQPQIAFTAENVPGTGKASLWATPYAELPIGFDDITVSPLKP